MKKHVLPLSLFALLAIFRILDIADAASRYSLANRIEAEMRPTGSPHLYQTDEAARTRMGSKKSDSLAQVYGAAFETTILALLAGYYLKTARQNAQLPLERHQ